jgi:hypothetical protein
LITGYTGAEVEGHDWEYILGRLQMLPWDQELAAGFLWTGRCVMVLALLMGVSFVLFEDVYKRIKGRCDVLLP